MKKNKPGAWIYVPRELYKSGIPDVLVVYQKSVFAYELKLQGNVPSPLQLDNLRNLSGNGAEAYLVTLLKNGELMFELYSEYEERTINYDKSSQEVQNS